MPENSIMNTTKRKKRLVSTFFSRSLASPLFGSNYFDLVIYTKSLRNRSNRRTFWVFIRFMFWSKFNSTKKISKPIFSKFRREDMGPYIYIHMYIIKVARELPIPWLGSLANRGASCCCSFFAVFYCCCYCSISCCHLIWVFTLIASHYLCFRYSTSRKNGNYCNIAAKMPQ